MVALLGVLVLFGTCGYAAADCITGARYQAIGDGTVQDCQTGLIWLQNAGCTDTSNNIPNPIGDLTWPDAKKWVAGLGDGLCGLTDGSSAGDWRLPTKTEWMAMIAYASKTKGYTSFPRLTNDAGNAQWSSGAGSSFTNVHPFYWSSTFEDDPFSKRWFVNLCDDGGAWGECGTSNPYIFAVWPVRGGQSGSFDTLRIE
jgi:hypothetical protein